MPATSETSATSATPNLSIILPWHSLRSNERLSVASVSFAASTCVPVNFVA